MTDATLQKLLDSHLDAVPGSVALVSRAGADADEVEVACAGFFDLEHSAPMQRDTIFRIASITKPIVAAAVMTLIDDERIHLDDPIGYWIPEIAHPSVLRTPASELDDTVPLERPLTVRDLLESTAGWGFAAEFETPAMSALFGIQLGPLPAKVPPVDEWLATLARIPLLDQPGRTWLYNTCSDLQGILLARVTGQSVPDALGERIFEPLGMVDTAFQVSAAKRHRFPSFYGRGSGGGLELMDAPDGEFSAPPAFPSGAGGLTSTLDDYLSFMRMLLAGGVVEAGVGSGASGGAGAGGGAGATGGSGAGRRLLSAESVRLMMTNHLDPAQRKASELFVEGQGWGYGGAVDVDRSDPWNVPGRYGWVGGSGTAAHIIPSTGTTTLLLTQVAMSDPTYPAIMRDFWAYANGTA